MLKEIIDQIRSQIDNLKGSIEPVKRKSKILKQYRIYFPNGYGASIIDNTYNKNLEVAVISKANAWGVDYNNDLFTDVTECQKDPDSLFELLEQIAELKTDSKRLNTITNIVYKAQDALRNSEYEYLDQLLGQILTEVD